MRGKRIIANWAIVGFVATVSVAFGGGAQATEPVAPDSSASASDVCEYLASLGVIDSDEIVDFTVLCSDELNVRVRDALGAASVNLPPAGMAVTYSSVVEDGAPTVPDFTVIHGSNGKIATVSGDGNDAVITGSASLVAAFGQGATTTAASSSVSPKCDNTTYSVSGQRWFNTVNWYYKTPTFGGQARVVAAMSAVADGIGACGQNKPNSAAHSYKGTTSTSSQVGDNVCSTSDLLNVIDSGPLSEGTLAAACTWRTSSEIVYSDIRIDSSNRSWYTQSSVTGCSGSATYDLQGVMTHEAGHLFGLNHVAQASGQIMGPTVGACETSQRKLGNGDLAGMKYLYPGT